MIKRYVYVPSTYGMFMGRGYGKKRTNNKRKYGLLFGKGNEGEIRVQKIGKNEAALLEPNGQEILIQAEDTQKPIIIEDEDDEWAILKPLIDAGKVVGKTGKFIIDKVGDGLKFGAELVGSAGWKPKDLYELSTTVAKEKNPWLKWGSLVGETAIKCLPFIIPLLV